MKFYISNDIKVKLLSDYRIDIERSEFLNIQAKIVLNTRRNLIALFQNLKNLRTFHIKNIFVGNILENQILRFFKLIFGEFELLIKILQNIPLGHKFALLDIKKGAYIKKYGEIIGVATSDINMGDWIHTHNIKSYYLEEIEK